MLMLPIPRPYLKKQGKIASYGIHYQPNICSIHFKTNNFMGTDLLKEKLKPPKTNIMLA